MQDTPLAFVLVIEAGFLESQAVLLMESLRAFGGEYAEAPILAVQPRTGPAIGRNTIDRIAGFNAIYLRANLNALWPDYPWGNKISAAAFAEEFFQNQAEVVCFLDSDLIFLSSPTNLTPPEGKKISVKPVDWINIGIKKGEAIPDYWQTVFDACQADPAKFWMVRSSMDQQEIIAYFNAGVIASRTDAGFFRTWCDNFSKYVMQTGGIQVQGELKFHLDQAFLAATVLSRYSQDQVHLLDLADNFPLNFFVKDFSKLEQRTLEEIHILHYHDLFGTTRWLEQIAFPLEMKRWLAERLPLKGAKKPTLKSRVSGKLRGILMDGR